MLSVVRAVAVAAIEDEPSLDGAVGAGAGAAGATVGSGVAL